jgi:hypothetical protein
MIMSSIAKLGIRAAWVLKPGEGVGLGLGLDDTP